MERAEEATTTLFPFPFPPTLLTPLMWPRYVYSEKGGKPYLPHPFQVSLDLLSPRTSSPTQPFPTLSQSLAEEEEEEEKYTFEKKKRRGGRRCNHSMRQFPTFRSYFSWANPHLQQKVHSHKFSLCRFLLWDSKHTFWGNLCGGRVLQVWSIPGSLCPVNIWVLHYSSTSQSYSYLFQCLTICSGF